MSHGGEKPVNKSHGGPWKAEANANAIRLLPEPNGTVSYQLTDGEKRGECVEG
jgi:hypothetical protein